MGTSEDIFPLSFNQDLCYESSTPTSQELSGNIFQSLSVSEWVILTQYHQEVTGTASALYWLSNTKYQPLLSIPGPVHSFITS